MKIEMVPGADFRKNAIFSATIRKTATLHRRYCRYDK